LSKVEKISRLQHPGVLRDFRWPPDLPTFGRFNLIYGWNGSGKTTLSRLFRHLEQRIVPPAGQTTICIEGNDIDGRHFPQSTIQVRVFNRDFVNESVFPIGGGDVPPIFVVGKESVEKQKEVDRLRTEKLKKEAELARARTSDQQAERDLDRHCTDQAKVIKDSLRLPGAGAYNEYDKRAYRTRAQQMVAAGDADTHRLDDSTRDKLLIQHRSSVKPRVPEVAYQLPAIEQLCGEVANVLATTVTSAALEALKDDPQLGDWTRHGLVLHKDRKSEFCLFCEQPLPAGRLAALEAHFSTEYDRFLQRVNELVGRLQAIAKQASDVRPADRAALYEDMTADYHSAEQALRQVLEKVRGLVDVLVQTLEEKSGQPFKSLELGVPSPDIEADAVDRLNQVIQRHNSACADFQVRTADARERLALNMIAQNTSEYSRLAEAAKVAANATSPIEAHVRRLSPEIERLEREIVEHRQPAEELNEDLRKYLGHGELRLEVKDTGYTLMRHGLAADSLSEGERTALALLYFLKSLGDRRFDLSNGVVVLDDPVSSLDANALYLAFGFIRQRTQHAAQLFLLTHNFTFFRQVRSWFHHLKGRNKKDINQRPARFYMLDRVRETDARCTALRSLDPLLEQYESEYHYLFACVHREASAAVEAKLEQNYGLPNIARRLLEMFLAFRRPQVAGELWQKLKDVKFDEAKKLRIVRFVHTHSHGDTIGEPEHDPSLLGEARSVLADLLEFMKSEDAEHFEAMVGLVSPPVEEEAAE
jgi:wobble nucleotide-excising tRNase